MLQAADRPRCSPQIRLDQSSPLAGSGCKSAETVPPSTRHTAGTAAVETTSLVSSGARCRGTGGGHSDEPREVRTDDPPSAWRTIPVLATAAEGSSMKIVWYGWKQP